MFLNFSPVAQSHLESAEPRAASAWAGHQDSMGGEEGVRREGPQEAGVCLSSGTTAGDGDCKRLSLNSLVG